MGKKKEEKDIEVQDDPEAAPYPYYAQGFVPI